MSVIPPSRIMSRAEHGLADAAQRREAVLAGNGLTALWSVLTVLDLPAGAPVLLPDLAAERLAGAVALAGLSPIFVDVREQTGMPTSADLAVAAASHSARAMVRCHLFGRRGRLPTPDPDCPQIVDATQCGVTARGLAGGLAAVLSFGPGRQLDLGTGGAVLTDDPALAREARARIQGLERDGAGILRAAPPWLDARLTVALAGHREDRRRRRARAQILREDLAALPGITPLDLADEDVPWRVSLRVADRRAAVQRALAAAGLAPSTLVAPLHRLTGRADGEFPVASALAAELVALDPTRLGEDPVATVRRATTAVAAILDRPLRNEAVHA